MFNGILQVSYLGGTDMIWFAKLLIGQMYFRSSGGSPVQMYFVQVKKQDFTNAAVTTEARVIYLDILSSFRWDAEANRIMHHW